uniref:Nuclear condensin complex subunit 3 C-terminal domain-containing protein n=1 Tax=Electrophorus electricus TaxID=8005 RepID=A0A4W4FVM5_ELEEL
MTAENELEIKEAFQRAQKAHNNKAKLVASLKNRYVKLEDKSEFHEEFLRCLKYAMIIYTREPAVENVIDFAVKFAVSFETPVNEEEEEEEEEEDISFLNFLFNFLLEIVDISHAVRFRVCQLVNKLLGSLSESAQIDDDLCERIHEVMLIRVTDKYPNVRIQAALAMARLQDPSNEHCPTIKAYILLLDNDSNPEVRRAVLSCIAPSAFTLPKIYKRTRDVKEKVRKLAYQVLAEKVHIRALTIAQRVSLLHQGLNDSADSVKDVVKTDLLPAWLQLLQGDVLQLLHRLDVENCAETAVSALHALFSMMTTFDELLQNGPQALCEFIKSKGAEGEELLERLLPEPAIFAEYLYSYLKSVPLMSEEEKADMTQLELVMTKEFIGQQLILLVGCLDTSEEGGRKRVLAVLQEMLVLPNTPLSLIGQLVQKLVGMLQDDQQRIQIAEIISDVREPIVSVDDTVDENEKRKKQVRLAEVKVRIVESKQALEECISCQDFGRAAELKDSISQLEELRAKISLEASQADHIKEQRVEKNDPETLLKCLTMCAEVIKRMNINRGICPTMNALIESLILPSVSNANPTVRNMAVVCVGTAALHSRDLANTHLVLLLQITQLDEPKVRISALRALIDQLLLNGINILQDKSTPQPSQAPDLLDSIDGQATQPSEEDEESPVQSVLKMLSEFLDSEISELRTETAEGLAKLMYCGRIVSAKLFSRLVLLWYNPVTEDDQRLRHCLGVFLQLYARESRAHQECVEQSFLLSMRTLFNAPVTSPLSEIDTSNVAELFVELTRPSALIQPAAIQGASVHESLAVRLCNEILRDASAPEVRLYCKTLGCLEISTEPGPANNELQQLLTEILQAVKDKYCIRAVEKVLSQLQGCRSAPTEAQDTVLAALDHNANFMFFHLCSFYMFLIRFSLCHTGQKKVTVAKAAKKSCKMKESSDESDEENVPDAPPVMRPSRCAKTAALTKTKQDLTALMNKEASP